MGEVFEDYVHRAFDRMFPLQSKRYLRLDDIRDKISTKYCYGLIAYENGVILVESKASLFTFEARVGHDITTIRSRLDDYTLMVQSRFRLPSMLCDRDCGTIKERFLMK